MMPAFRNICALSMLILPAGASMAVAAAIPDDLIGKWSARAGGHCGFLSPVHPTATDTAVEQRAFWHLRIRTEIRHGALFSSARGNSARCKSILSFACKQSTANGS
jgi:hypothetical protein